MAANWNAILSNANSMADILIILRKVLAGLDAKADLTTINEAIAEIGDMKLDVDAGLKAINDALINFDVESEEAIGDLWDAINAALAAGAGEAGWADSLVVTEHNRTQRDKNNDSISLHDYCKLDGSDETENFIKATTVARFKGKKLVAFYGRTRISSDVSVRHIACDLSSLDIICLETAKLIIGGSAGNGVENPDQLIGSVRNLNYQYDVEKIINPTIVCIGAKDQYIKIRFSQYILFYQSTDPATYPNDASQAYSTFDIGYSIKIVVDTDPRFQNGGSDDGAGSRIQWFNENTINLNRCIGFFMRGNYNHNANIINGGSFEGKSKIYLEDGGRNKFKDIRFEGAEYDIYCGPRTDSNLFEKKFYGSTANFWTFSYRDFGLMNMFRTTFDQNANVETVLSISSNENIQFDGKYGNYNYRTPSKVSLKSNASGARLLSEVNRISFLKGDYLLIYSENLDMTVSTYIATVDCFDKQGNLIDLSSVSFDSGNFKLTSQKGRLEGSFNTSGVQRLCFLKKNVIDIAYIDLRILSAGDISKSKAKSIVAKRVNFSDSKLRHVSDSFSNNSFFSLIYQKPTAVIAPIGTIFQKYDGSEQYICSFSTTTFLSSNADLSALTVNINGWNVSGFGDAKPGDKIGIELNNGAVHWSEIISISLGVVVLKSALIYSADKENLVYISRLSNF